MALREGDVKKEIGEQRAWIANATRERADAAASLFAAFAPAHKHKTDAGASKTLRPDAGGRVSEATNTSP
jgi:hypothetical protein